jgi:N-acetylglutamate synthase-like GNAT family acetyltransferase
MKIDYLGNHIDFVAELAELHFNEWNHLSPERTLEDRTNRLKEIAQATDIPLMWIAIENHQAIGSAALVYEDMKTRKDLSPWLASVFVKPQFRGKGIGSQLVIHIESEAKKRSIKKLFLFTEHARQLYLKLGWHDLEECEYHGANVVIMYKQLFT